MFNSKYTNYLILILFILIFSTTVLAVTYTWTSVQRPSRSGAHVCETAYGKFCQSVTSGGNFYSCDTILSSGTATCYSNIPSSNFIRSSSSDTTGRSGNQLCDNIPGDPPCYHVWYRTDVGGHTPSSIGPVSCSTVIYDFTMAICTSERPPVQCTPDCSNAASYCTGTTFDDGCGGTCSGTKDCSGCTPNCGSRTCGAVPNGCGSSCGSCSSGYSCSNGNCIADCSQNGESCSDDGDCCSDNCINYFCYDSSACPVEFVDSSSVDNLMMHDSGTDDSGNGIHLDNSGNVYVTGSIDLSGTGKMITLKYDSNGNLLWNATEEADGGIIGADIVTDDSGNVYVAGTKSPGVGKHYPYIVKYDQNGGKLWDQPYIATGGGTTNENIVGIALDGLGNIYASGSSQFSDIYGDFNTLKYDTNGNFKWNEYYGNPNKQDACWGGIAADDSGNVYVTGFRSWSTAGHDNDYLTIKYDSNGNVVWTENFGERSAIARDMVMDEQGNLYIIGTKGFVKYDQNGNELASADYIKGEGITVDSLGNIYVMVRDGPNYKENYMVLKYDSNLNYLWSSRFDSGDRDIPYAIDSDLSGNIYITGLYDDGVDMDILTIRYDACSTSCEDACDPIEELCNGIDDTGEGDTDEGCNSCQNDDWFEYTDPFRTNKYCISYATETNRDTANLTCNSYNAKLAELITYGQFETIVTHYNNSESLNGNNNPWGLFFGDSCSYIQSKIINNYDSFGNSPNTPDCSSIYMGINGNNAVCVGVLENKCLDDVNYNGNGIMGAVCEELPTGCEPGFLIGSSRSCYTGPAGTEGVGICIGGTETCQPDGTWTLCIDEVFPDVEAKWEDNCGDGLNNDCDLEQDWDFSDFIHGEENCPIRITAISIGSPP